MTLIKHLAAIYPSILFIFKNLYQNLTKTAHKFVFHSPVKLTGSPFCIQPDPHYTLGLFPPPFPHPHLSTPRSQVFLKRPCVL